MVLGEDHVSLLGSLRGYHGVDLADLDRVEVLASLLNHGLGCTSVNHEDEGVVVLDGLDGRLGASGVLHDGVLVPGDLLGDRANDSLCLAGKGEGLGASEGSVVPFLRLDGGMSALLHLFSNLLSLYFEL